MEALPREPWPPGVIDPFGRELTDIRNEAELATRAVELIDDAIALGLCLKLGREAGPKALRRLEVSRDRFAHVAGRDQEIAEQLDAYQRGEFDWVAARQEGTTRLTRKR